MWVKRKDKKAHKIGVIHEWDSGWGVTETEKTCCGLNINNKYRVVKGAKNKCVVCDKHSGEKIRRYKHKRDWFESAG